MTTEKTDRTLLKWRCVLGGGHKYVFVEYRVSKDEALFHCFECGGWARLMEANLKNYNTRRQMRLSLDDQTTVKQIWDRYDEIDAKKTTQSLNCKCYNCILL